MESHIPIECMVSTLLWLHLIVPILIPDELHILQYAPYYDVFEMLNDDKMEHWGSSGVQKNKIVFKINWIHEKCKKKL